MAEKSLEGPAVGKAGGGSDWRTGWGRNEGPSARTSVTEKGSVSRCYGWGQHFPRSWPVESLANLLSSSPGKARANAGPQLLLTRQGGSCGLWASVETRISEQAALRLQLATESGSQLDQAGRLGGRRIWTLHSAPRLGGARGFSLPILGPNIGKRSTLISSTRAALGRQDRTRLTRQRAAQAPEHQWPR